MFLDFPMLLMKIDAKQKRKRTRKDSTSLPAPTVPDSEASAAAPKRRKRAAKASTSAATGVLASADDDYDSPVDPEDPDWDMWIRAPSTRVKGPLAKETLVAGKLDWEIPSSGPPCLRTSNLRLSAGFACGCVSTSVHRPGPKGTLKRGPGSGFSKRSVRGWTRKTRSDGGIVCPRKSIPVNQ
jgi:hypothetical protein